MAQIACRHVKQEHVCRLIYLAVVHARLLWLFLPSRAARQEGDLEQK